MRRPLLLLALCLALGLCACAAPGAGRTAPPTASPAAPASSPVATPSSTPGAEPADGDMVRVLDYVPALYVELRYATAGNFTGQVIYDFQEAYLRYGTVKKLAAAAAELAEAGYTLRIWDAFRPVDAQWKLWEICPDPAYVANPETGYSGHSRGDTVDVTLCRADGGSVAMPTGFDAFSPLADRDYADVADPEALEHVQLLERVMTAHGFAGYAAEWWHFSDTDEYPVNPDFTPPR